MKCDCIETIESEVKESGFGGKKVTKATIETSFVFGKKGMYSTTSTNFHITLDGAKKPKVIQVMHTFCPFCGVKIQDETPES